MVHEMIKELENSRGFWNAFLTGLEAMQALLQPTLMPSSTVPKARRTIKLFRLLFSYMSISWPPTEVTTGRLVRRDTKPNWLDSMWLAL